ncbi:AEC family transporter [Kineobactrum sediminis]|uniref:AEC family transporter n=1 Tax=Kineobactrum sediminis TaxID=1905677 RepID=A0A2N5Y458_9GAMM|nr:AEC family transporter [Kineobactrum sediminis]PLW83183.1 AEC family transporter [Kineobactrum sediminis]
MLSASAFPDLFLTALSVSVPTFGWVVLGMVLRRAGVLSPGFIDAVSRIAFNVGLPLMLFISAAGIDFSGLGGATYLLAGAIATVITLAASWAYGRWRNFPRPALGVFVQAAFRSNLAIIGFALCHAAYGEQGLMLAALPVALMTALYNVLAVWVLQVTHGGSRSLLGIVRGIIVNPLLIGIFAGVCVAVSGLPLPAVSADIGWGLSQFFLPVMLACIGGAMRLNIVYTAGAVTWEATAWRLCVAPVLGMLVAVAMGIDGAQLGVLFLLLSSPVAAASFVMVVAARGDGTLAANIIVLTTLLSIVTVTLGFAALVLAGLAAVPV